MNMNLCVRTARNTTTTQQQRDETHFIQLPRQKRAEWAPQSASLHWLNITFTPQTLLSDATHNKSIQPPQEQGTRVWTALRGLRAVCKYSFMSWDQRGPVVSGEETTNYWLVVLTRAATKHYFHLNLENSSRPKDIRRKQANIHVRSLTHRIFGAFRSLKSLTAFD